MQPNSNTSYKKSSFGPAFSFIGKKEKEALSNYYEFCRKMDDIADEPTVENPLQELLFWREEVENIYSQTAKTDLGKQLQIDVTNFSIPKDRFLLLIEGMEADLNKKEYATLEDLEWYLYRVAVIVGQATLDILGVIGPASKKLSMLLGSAVQLTNIIRDVTTDASLQRVYIPTELLKKESLTKEDVLSLKNTSKVSKILAELAILAEQKYRDAYEQMKSFPRLKMLPCKIMGCVYAQNLAKIKRENFVYSQPIKLTKFEKIQGVFCALFKTFF